MAKQNEYDFLISNQPASFISNPWLDASVCGSGVVGAAVLGAFSNEKILFNHSELRSGGHTGVLQDVSDKFPNVRKLYNDIKVLDAERVLAGEFEKRNYRPSPNLSHPVGMLCLDFFHEGQVVDYKRVTDMLSGEVNVSFSAGGSNFERSLFVSRRDDVIAYCVKKSGAQKINCVISFQGDLNVQPLQKPVMNIKGAKATDSKEEVKYENGFVLFSSKTSAGLEYGMVSRVIVNGGRLENKPNGIHIIDADTLTVFSKVFMGGGVKKAQDELNQIKLSYDKLQSQNDGVHRRLYEQMSLNLVGENITHFPSLIGKVRDGVLPPGLVMCNWNFARYLVLCGFGGVATPNGIWCGAKECEGDVLSFDGTAQLLLSTITNSVNPDAILSVFEYYEKYAQDLKKNAARVYGLEGYFVPNVVSPESGLFGRVDSATLHFVASSALAANIFYSYFLSSGDIKTLKSRIFPFMKEIYNFYSDFLKLDANGFYTTVPSYSPNSTPGNMIGGKPLVNFHFASNSTIDFLALDVLLDNLIHASITLGVNEHQVWQEMKRKIPTAAVNGEGAIKEYTNSPFVDKVQNNGLMHAYGLWPLKNYSFNDKVVSYKPSVTVGGNAEISLKRASAVAVLSRLGKAGAYQDARTLAMGATQLAHTGNGEDVKGTLIKLVASCFSDSGLCLTNDWRGSGFTKNVRPSLDICGNLGFATAITECLVQSDKNNLRILPCVFDGLEIGEITGISTDFGATIDMEWDIKRARLVMKIMPKMNIEINVYLNDVFRKLKSKDLNLDNQNCVRGLKLVAGKSVTLEV
ncbi:MAG: glycoside hydrolase family 95 protein [Firmicutes bacterium]|nr:glycoside hydrolase family 95 protein [Bacillota bacterium]